RPKGCPACDYTGYMGRVGLFELLVVDEKVCDLILNRAMAHDIRKHARRHQGMLTLREAGLIKCVQHVTTPEEVLQHTDHYED
ncbi:MAG TPA: secretion system protein E, partial [Candidatus Hydrogenedentes bacterium]|nr:secretion system protein E [Candidatus Hydrogenedentota bacterium]